MAKVSQQHWLVFYTPERFFTFNFHSICGQLVITCSKVCGGVCSIMQEEYQLPPGTEDLAKPQLPLMYSTPPSGSSSVPAMRKSNSGSNGSMTKIPLRKRTMGVRFVSPSRSKSPEEENSNCTGETQCESPQIESAVSTEQSTISQQDNPSERSVPATHTLASQCSSDNDNSIQRIDLTSNERQTTLSSFVKSFQSSTQPTPTCTHTPATALTATVTNTVHTKMGQSNKVNTDVLKSNYSNGKVKLPTLSLSLEHPVTCARMMPLDSLKLKRNSCATHGVSKDGGQTVKQDNKTLMTITEHVSDSRSQKKTEHHVEQSAAIAAVPSESNQAVAGTCASGTTVTCETNTVSGENEQRHLSDDNTRTTETMEMESSAKKAGDSSKEVIDLTHLHSPNSPQASVPPFRSNQDSTTTNYVAEESSTNADSAVQLTPLPKLGSSEALKIMFGREPSQRNWNSGYGTKGKLPDTFNASPFGTPSDQHLVSEFLQGRSTTKRPRQTVAGDETNVQPTKRARLLPPFLLSAGMNSDEKHRQQQTNTTCTETEWITLCRRHRPTIIQLERRGLLKKLSEVDLDSPTVCQVHAYIYHIISYKGVVVGLDIHHTA